MRLWRIHLRPDADHVGPVDLCLNQGVVGIGWRVSRKPRNFDEYLSLGEKEYGNKGWRTAANAIGKRMKTDDLVWMRDFFGVYYLGKIDGGWEYGDGDENTQADIVNVRRCRFFRVGTSVTGKIVNCFRPSATVQPILDRTAKLFSVLTYNRVANVNVHFDGPSDVDIFGLLSDVDLEDVVGLYLQHKKRLLVIPSSRSRLNDTIAYEFQLVNPSTGQPAYVQVKSGNVILDPIRYYGSEHMFYLFSPGGYVCTSQRENVICITREELLDFLKYNEILFPLYIALWHRFREQIADRMADEDHN